MTLKFFMNYLYIMGRGHSGSTILDALIGNGKSCFSIGELVSGMPRRNDVCSCGKKIKDCEFWCKVKRKFEFKSNITWEEASIILQDQAHLKSFLKSWFPFSKVKKKRLIKINSLILESISEVSGQSYLIDSSKEFTRALFLAKYIREGKIIHLVRNPLRILASNLLRIKEGNFRFLRYTFDKKGSAYPFIFLSALGWIVGNILGEVVQASGRVDVLKIRYEDLCEDPSSELKKIEEFADIDLSDVISKVEQREKMTIEHMIAGNRIRRKGKFIFKPEKKNERFLPAKYRYLGIFLTWPLMWKYGYLN